MLYQSFKSLQNTRQHSILSFIGLCFSLFSSSLHANQDLISLFPIDHYNQTITNWIKPSDPDYNKLLLNHDSQQKHVEIFYNHYFGTSSPWNADYVNQILQQPTPNDLITLEQGLITSFSNQNKPEHQIGYGENFRPYSQNWIDTIATNIDISQFNNPSYHPNQRGIAIDNLHARVLPTEDVYLNSYKLAGQGYPFDNLQMSALWAGTPVYIIGETRDRTWLLVMTPDYIAWVKSNGIARANDTFINQWKAAAKNKLAAITHTQTGLVDEKGQFLISAYVGSVFPANEVATGIKIMIPVVDTDHHATIKTTVVSFKNAVMMPLTATPHHFSTIMSHLLGRPYGWGSMYFYNDCSAELKSLLTPFGIWLPRHSSDQVTVGKIVDMTAFSQNQRLSYLIENGRKFLTIVYIGGHVFLYIGSYSNNQTITAMTYQNIWGLSPNPPTRRAVIGQSVLFPLLLQYSEDPTLISLAAKNFFQVSYLDEFPNKNDTLKSKTMNLKSLMYPDSITYL